MSNDFDTPYGTFAPIYQARGFWPRALFNGTDPHTGKLAGKACKIRNWQLPDPEWPSGEITRWTRDYPTYNIGLLMGSRFPDGSYFGAFDNDDDRYVRLSQTLLRDPICSRIGKKGIAHFVRYYPLSGQPELKYRCRGKTVAEWFLKDAILVIPPSIHPETNQPYRWVGSPLHEIDPLQLPLMEI